MYRRRLVLIIPARTAFWRSFCAGALLLLGAGWAGARADDSVALELPLPPARQSGEQPADGESRAFEVAPQPDAQDGKTGRKPPPLSRCEPLPPMPPLDPAAEPPPAGADTFSALRAEYDENGVAQATGVSFRIVSILESGALLCEADSGEYDSNTGAARLSGAVHVSLEDSDLSFTCSELDFDPMTGNLAVDGLSIAVPFAELVPAERLPAPDIQAKLGSHFYSATPQQVFIKAASLRVSRSESHSEFVLRGVRITHSPRPDPDLYVNVAELRMADDDRIIFKDIALIVSGTEVFSWPKLTRNLRKERKVIGLGVPEVHFDRQIGLAWRQPLQLDFKSLQMEGIFDYSPDYGLRLKGSAFVQPAPLGRLSFEAGESSTVDVQFRNVMRRDKYNFVYRQEVKSPMAGVQDLNLDAEYGAVSSFTDPIPGKGIPGIAASDTRLAAMADVSFNAVPLGGRFYLTSAGEARIYQYVDSNKDYRVLGGSAGLVYHEPDFDNFVLYSLNKTSGEPVFSFDEVREEEVDFAGSVRLLPEWRHVVRGIYDVTKGEFNQLQVGALKKQRSYEMGLYWDFARDSAGVEFGLLMN